MDSLITAAAQALAGGNPIGALKWVALRNDAPALALRGIAMAQLGDFDRAKALLRKAARAFGPKLGEAWPADVPRSTLLARAFRAKYTNELHRARLRVEVGRVRFKLRTLADVSATTRGFALAPRRARRVVVLAPPVEDPHASLLAFLADGESWSSSALSLAMGASARNVQRALDALASAGKVQSYGRGRAQRWVTRPLPGFTTTLLLPGPLPSG